MALTPTELGQMAKTSRARAGRNLARRWDTWNARYAAYRRRQRTLRNLWEKKADTRTKRGREVIARLNEQYSLEIKRCSKLKDQLDVLVSDLTAWAARQAA
jgi:hypothetical protein